MKQLFGYTRVAFVTVCLLCLPLAGCAGPSQAAGHALAQAYSDAIDPDGPGGAVITPEEAAVIKPLMDAYFTSLEETDWEGEIKGAGLAAAAIVSTRLLGIDVTQFIRPIGRKKPLLGKLANLDADGKPATRGATGA